jgi:GNAT superfamily N-acetyltransferase
MSRILITDADFSEKEAMARFLDLRDPDVFEYEYRTYMPEKYVYVVAKDESGKIVGSQAFMPYLLNVNGRALLTARSERTKVSQELRGLQLFSKLMEQCVQRGRAHGMEFIWGATMAIRAFQKAGFHFHHGFIERAICCIKPVQAILDFTGLADKKKKLELAKILTLPLSTFARSTFCYSGINRGLSFHGELLGLSDLDQLYLRIKENGNLVYLVQDEQFRRWAYELDPGRSYLRIYAYSGRELAGYVILDTSDRKMALLSDFAAMDSQILRSLIVEARRRLRHYPHTFLFGSYNFRNAAIRRVVSGLYQSGFVPINREGHKCIRPIDFLNMNVLGQIEDWYVTDIWYTLFREPDAGLS